eukprot:m.195485 g.195485  ORF g.195485 m.195485 type:complete len:72 (-) comp16803_c0_seq2:132-347(-)
MMMFLQIILPPCKLIKTRRRTFTEADNQAQAERVEIMASRQRILQHSQLGKESGVSSQHINLHDNKQPAFG